MPEWGPFCDSPRRSTSSPSSSALHRKGDRRPGGRHRGPDDPVTHLSYSCSAGSPNLHFTDVSVSDNSCKHVYYLWAEGVIAGCSSDTYCPDGDVSRQEMAKFLSNGFNLQLYGP